MRTLLGGLILGTCSLLAPAVASADQLVVPLPRFEVHVGGPRFQVDVTPAGARPVVYAPPPAVYVPAPPPAYVPPPAPVAWNYGGSNGAWRQGRNHVGMFGWQLRRDMSEIERDTYAQVQRGMLRPEAMQALQAGRMEVEQAFGNAAAKGFLTFQDRNYLEGRVASLRSLTEQYRCHPGNGGHGRGWGRRW